MGDNQMTRIIIVDSQDNVIGLKQRDQITYRDIYRVSALWLTDSKTGDVLLAQRKWNKRNDPGKWSAGVAGTVDEGEDYEVNIKKETEEEMGLTNIVVTLGPKQFVDDGKHRFFCQWYYAQIDKDTTKLTIQEDEVEAVKWMPAKELITDLKTNPDRYPPSTQASLEALGLMR